MYAMDVCLVRSPADDFVDQSADCVGEFTELVPDGLADVAELFVGGDQFFVEKYRRKEEVSRLRKRFGEFSKEIFRQIFSNIKSHDLIFVVH